MTTEVETIEDIREKEQKIKDYEHILALQSWDMETGMPKEAAEDRARQMGTIQDHLTRELQDPAWVDALALLEKEQDDSIRRWYRLLKKRYREYSLLPPDFMTRFVKATALSRDAWLKSREADDFMLFLPCLEDVTALLREKCEIIGFEGEPYNALLDEYEPGARADHLENLFKDLASELGPLLERAAAERSSEPEEMIVPVEIQRKISLRVLRDMGYDFDAGRLDQSVHPFTSTLGGRDVRVTSSFKADDLLNSLFSTVHEGGHGLYEQNLPENWRGTMAAEGASMGVHESQSRMWENIIGRSRGFAAYLKRVLADEFADLKVDEAELYRRMNRIEPDFIRVDADEYSYNLHIILRFRLERDLINGRIEVRDLRDLWNDSFKALMGFSNSRDLTGVLQDIHWSEGLMGYFPSYTLGNLYAAQIWNSLLEDLGDQNETISRGDFIPILEWLKKKVHSRGALYTAEELMSDICGRSSDSSFFINYLKEKQKSLYD